MKTEALLLDTCALIWMALDAGLTAEAEEAITSSAQAGLDVMVSPVSAWELGLLASKRKLPAAQGPAALFDEFVERAGVGLEKLTPGILVDASFLPGDFHNDPADRIIVATAKAVDLIVVTRDRAILDYARQGYVRAMAC